MKALVDAKPDGRRLCRVERQPRWHWGSLVAGTDERHVRYSPRDRVWLGPTGLRLNARDDDLWEYETPLAPAAPVRVP